SVHPSLLLPPSSHASVFSSQRAPHPGATVMERRKEGVVFQRRRPLFLRLSFFAGNPP
ncbi:hypothetical protein KUCAC02_004119, partial [Chaenocephalus aceratus]